MSRERELPPWITENLPDELVNSGLFKFNVTLRVKDPQTGKNRKIEVDMLPDLNIEMDTVLGCMEEMPSQYAYWAAIYSELRNNVSLLERALKVHKGKLVKKVQQDAKREGIRITGEQTKTVLEADDHLTKLDEQLAKVQMHTGKVYHMMEALKMKSELARSLAATRRQEYSNT